MQFWWILACVIEARKLNQLKLSSIKKLLSMLVSNHSTPNLFVGIYSE
jgi:hypothetical protein